MGLKIHTLAEIPDSISKNYYLYILDYYNWDECTLQIYTPHFYVI